MGDLSLYFECGNAGGNGGDGSNGGGDGGDRGGDPASLLILWDRLMHFITGGERPDMVRKILVKANPNAMSYLEAARGASSIMHTWLSFDLRKLDSDVEKESERESERRGVGGDDRGRSEDRRSSGERQRHPSSSNVMARARQRVRVAFAVVGPWLLAFCEPTVMEVTTELGVARGIDGANGANGSFDGSNGSSGGDGDDTGDNNTGDVMMRKKSRFHNNWSYALTAVREAAEEQRNEAEYTKALTCQQQARSLSLGALLGALRVGSNPYNGRTSLGASTMGPMTSVRDGSESLETNGHSNGSMEGGLPQELMVRTARLLHAGLEDGCELVQVTLLREGSSLFGLDGKSGGEVEEGGGQHGGADGADGKGGGERGGERGGEGEEGRTLTDMGLRLLVPAFLAVMDRVITVFDKEGCSGEALTLGGGGIPGVGEQYASPNTHDASRSAGRGAGGAGRGGNGDAFGFFGGGGGGGGGLEGGNGDRKKREQRDSQRQAGSMYYLDEEVLVHSRGVGPPSRRAILQVCGSLLSQVNSLSKSEGSWPDVNLSRRVSSFLERHATTYR